MLKRTITGVFILILVAGFIALRYVSNIFFDAFVFVTSITATYEVIKCITSGENKIKLYTFLPYIYCTLIFACYVLFQSGVISFNNAFMIEMLVILICFAISFILDIVNIGLRRKNREVVSSSGLINNSLNSMIVILYPGFILSFLYKINSFGLELGMIFIIMTFVVTMITDTFAYLGGTLTRGKGPKVCPEISPKKGLIGVITGTLGGIVAGVIGYVLFYKLKIINSALLSVAEWKVVILFVLIGVLGAIVTQVGDFLSSAIKRKHQIKDFGNIFPGHGGVMDRIDGLMFNAISVYILASLFII